MPVLRFALILLLVSGSIRLSQAKNEMPIIAYWGVPANHTSETAFRTFSECGFTVSIYPYPNLNNLIEACRIAEKQGVQVLGQCPELKAASERTANALRKERGFYGYFIQDEPSTPEIKQQQKTIEKLRQIDSTHIFYLNLHPFYHQEWVKPTLKVENYSDYLKVASATSCQQISFDFYPITTAGIRPTWYNNLEMVRRESIRAGKPFWGFVLSVPHDVPFTPNTYYPTPTLSSLRLQIYSNLAYGAQGIQYFTYWTPDGSNSFHFHDGPIGLDGKKTKTYYLVQRMNRELKVVSKLFYDAKVTSVHHLGGTLPQGTTRLTKMPLNLQSLKVVSSKGTVVSQLEKDGHHYLAIVNKDHEHSIKVLIKPLNETPRQLTKALKEIPIKDSYNVAAGDILLFKLK